MKKYMQGTPLDITWPLSTTLVCSCSASRIHLLSQRPSHTFSQEQLQELPCSAMPPATRPLQIHRIDNKILVQRILDKLHNIKILVQIIANHVMQLQIVTCYPPPNTIRKIMGLIILTNLRLVLLIETFATQTHTDIFHSQASIYKVKVCTMARLQNVSECAASVGIFITVITQNPPSRQITISKYSTSSFHLMKNGLDRTQSERNIRENSLRFYI